jgi:hypothetical protein
MADLQRAAFAEVHQAIRKQENEVTGIVTRNECIQQLFALVAKVRLADGISPDRTLI